MTTTEPAEPTQRSAAHELADELLDVFFDAEPLWATLAGIRNRDDRLADLTREAEDAVAARLDDIRRRAEALETADPQDRLTRDVVVASARAGQARIDTRLIELTVSDYFVAPGSALLNFLTEVGLTDGEQASAYLRRLEQVPAYLEAAARRHQGGTAAGRTGVRRLVEGARKQVDDYLAMAVDSDPFARPEPPADGEGVDLDAFSAERRRILTDVVRPAFAAYRDAIGGDVLTQARPDDRPGLCHVPGGDACYAALARVQTTTERTPEELHQTGLDVIARLAEEYAEVGERVFGTSELQAIFDRMRNDPALRYTTREEMVADAEAAIRRAEEAAPRWFGRLPSQRCRVLPAPAEVEQGAPGAYYMGPALDGTRPGTYYTNTYQPTERVRTECESIAFHEAVPGHHFQITLAQELTGLPLLRRLGEFTAYIEGWGLYSERLAEEMGLYSDDVQRLGMLSTDSMRAMRLVVDTGIHALGWSRERAVAFCHEHTPMASIDIESEIDRYIIDPGQALAYMVGRLEIQRMRAEAERTLSRLGSAFDVKAFHDLVLGVGPLPLSVLADVVRSWADAGGSSPLVPAP